MEKIGRFLERWSLKNAQCTVETSWDARAKTMELRVRTHLIRHFQRV
jgi:hypothetical protein